jgi:hypothetical protein
MQAFKSRKNAIAARESLDLLLNERQTK